MPSWSVDLSLSGRDLKVVALEPLGRIGAPGPCSVVALVSGGNVDRDKLAAIA